MSPQIVKTANTVLRLWTRVVCNLKYDLQQFSNWSFINDVTGLGEGTGFITKKRDDGNGVNNCTKLRDIICGRLISYQNITIEAFFPCTSAMSAKYLLFENKLTVLTKSLSIKFQNSLHYFLLPSKINQSFQLSLNFD